MGQRLEPRVNWRFTGELCFNAGGTTGLRRDGKEERFVAKEIVAMPVGNRGRIYLEMAEFWGENHVEDQLEERLSPLVSAGIFTRYTVCMDGLELFFELQNGSQFCETAVRNGIILITALGMGDSALLTPDIVFVPTKRISTSVGRIPWANWLRDRYGHQFYFGRKNHPELFPQSLR